MNDIHGEKKENKKQNSIHVQMQWDMKSMLLFLCLGLVILILILIYINGLLLPRCNEFPVFNGLYEG